MAQEYSRGKDFISSAKLNYFHYVLKELMGYTIHPMIDIQSLESEQSRESSGQLRIADLGTQTAVWLSDIAEDASIPNVQVDGFDLSSAFFPPEAWLPKNVRLHIQDINAEFPLDFHGVFDIVHFRLFLTLTTEQVRHMISQACVLLRPGGYIQWTEHDKTDMTTTTANPGLKTQAAQAFIDLQMKPFPGYNAHWVNEIASCMSTVGFDVLAEQRIKVKPRLYSQMNELHLLSIMDVPVGLSSAVDTFRDEHLEALKEEYSKGVSTIDGFICIVGRKQ